MKVYALPANEDWICDQLVVDWNKYSGISCDNPYDADIIWLLSDWRWRNVPMHLLVNKKVVTTVHHIVPDKFDKVARADFAVRDSITNLYHVYNQRTYDFIQSLTKKPILLIPYWANQNLWKQLDNKLDLRRKYRLPENAYIIGSFQRDTEGSDLRSPKLEKGPDLLADAITKMTFTQCHVLLAGWRRQYIIDRLEKAMISYSYFERPSQQILNELYNTLSLYMVTSRHEGGPQALIECGLTNVPVVSTPVGIAEQVLPYSAINIDVTLASPAVPDVSSMKLPQGIERYKAMFESLLK